MSVSLNFPWANGHDTQPRDFPETGTDYYRSIQCKISSCDELFFYSAFYFVSAAPLSAAIMQAGVIDGDYDSDPFDNGP